MSVCGPEWQQHGVHVSLNRAVFLSSPLLTLLCFLGRAQRLSNSCTAGHPHSVIFNQTCLGPWFLPELSSPSSSEWEGFHQRLFACLVSPGRSLAWVIFALSPLCSGSPSVFRSRLTSIQNHKIGFSHIFEIYKVM